MTPAGRQTVTSAPPKNLVRKKRGRLRLPLVGDLAWR
jgi:hypothetical protein